MTDSSKRFKTQDLLQEINSHVWYRTFVTTFMMHIAQLDNPFDHNIKIGCTAMQKSWDIFFDDMSYTIIHSSAIYQLICIYFQFINSLRRLFLFIIYRLCNMFPTHGVEPWAQQLSQLSSPSVMRTLT